MQHLTPRPHVRAASFDQCMHEQFAREQKKPASSWSTKATYTHTCEGQTMQMQPRLWGPSATVWAERRWDAAQRR
eukprot:5676578-Pyramimonas_sp.AAC.1